MFSYFCAFLCSVYSFVTLLLIAQNFTQIYLTLSDMKWTFLQDASFYCHRTLCITVGRILSICCPALSHWSLADVIDWPRWAVVDRPYKGSRSRTHTGRRRLRLKLPRPAKKHRSHAHCTASLRLVNQRIHWSLGSRRHFELKKKRKKKKKTTTNKKKNKKFEQSSRDARKPTAFPVQ